MEESTTAAFNVDAWVIARIDRKTKDVTFLNKDSSHGWFSSDLSGNFTRKFISTREALEVMSRWRAQSMQSVYNFKVMPLADAQKVNSKSDDGNYETKMDPTGVGIK